MGDKWTAFKNITWTFLKVDQNPPVMICERCGGTEEYTYPVLMHESSERMFRFSKKHQHCKINEHFSSSDNSYKKKKVNVI